MNWHLEKLCAKLDDFRLGKVTRLIVMMPPRHGKSELASRLLPAFVLGVRPSSHIIAASYSAELAESMCRDVQRVIDSDPYRACFAACLPTMADKNHIRTSSAFDIVGRGGGGGYRCAGVGGPITGHGANYIIIDDPIKNREEAFSATYRERVWQWYMSTLYTRLQGHPQSIMLILTRWHEDDLAGRLLKQAREDGADKWDIFNIPAIKSGGPTETDPRNDGEAIWPDIFPIEKLRSIKATIIPSIWSAMYQQSPTTEGGNVIQEAWIKRYSVLPDKIDEWFQSWDFTFKQTTFGSYVVGQVWARKGSNYYLADQYRKRVGFVEMLDAFVEMSSRYPQAIRKKVEEKANGAAIIDSLKQHVTGIIPVNPHGDKEQRLRAVEPLFHAGNVYIPEYSLDKPWVRDYIEEITKFPASEHDDQVDATTQALSDAGKSIDYNGYRSISGGIRGGLLSKKGGIL